MEGHWLAGPFAPVHQVERLADWDYPDETFSDFPAFTTISKKKILGLNAAKLYGVEVPEELQLRDETPAKQEAAAAVGDQG